MDGTLPRHGYAEKPARYFDNARTDIAPLLPARAGRVLEIGCGTGATMTWLRSVRDVEHATGIELMPAAAATARAAFDSVRVGDVTDPALYAPLAKFDLIIALDVLEHIAYPEHVVAGLLDHLTDGGCFIASIPNIGHYSATLPLLFAGRWTYRTEGILDRTHLRFFDETSARALFEDNGFTIDKQQYTNFFPFLDSIPLIRKNRRARWYTTRLLQMLMPRHMHIFRFLIRATAKRR